MGPNEGKSPIEIQLCYARAIMSWSPIFFADPFEYMKLLKKAASEARGISTKWVKQKVVVPTINASKESYIYIDKQGGVNSEKAPLGEEVAATMDVNLGEIAFTRRFERSVRFLESLNDEAKLGINGSLDDQTKFSKTESTQIRRHLKETIANLNKTVKACAPDFNATRILEFRKWLRGFPDTTRPDKPTFLALNDPNRLLKFIENLKEERNNYCIDAILYGSISTIGYFCGICASKSEEGIHSKEAWLTFNRLALCLTESEETNPLQILRLTVQLGYEHGFLGELLEIVLNYREKYSNLIEEGLNSKTVDECLWKLYAAIPFAWGAKIVLESLDHYSSGKLDVGKARLLKSQLCIVEEDIVRLTTNPFYYQILDLDGSSWKGHKEEILKVKFEEGVIAAKKAADKLVEQHLIYPRALIPALLDEEEIS